LWRWFGVWGRWRGKGRGLKGLRRAGCVSE
jgi:hypothetical protein